MLVSAPGAWAQSSDAEDILRNLPSPTINYHLEHIRVTPALVRATEPVPLPPEEPSYEARKIVEKVKSVETTPMIRSTRKIISNLSTPRSKQEMLQASTASNTPSMSASATAAMARAVKPPPVATSTRIIAAVKVLAANQDLKKLQDGLASDTALAKDIFNLFVEKWNPEASSDEAAATETETSKFASIMATAAELEKKKDWQGIKDLFSENPEAGEVPDGLRFQIQAELNAEKPNYKSAQRFANQIIEKEESDPLANYALALYYYYNPKPNVEKARKALDIALKAKNPPEGASSLNRTMMLKKMLLPILLLLAGIGAGINWLIKKRKTAQLNILASEPALTQEKPVDAGSLPPQIVPTSKFKEKLLAMKEKFLALAGKLKIPGRKKTAVQDENPAPADNRPKQEIETPANAAPENSSDPAAEPKSGKAVNEEENDDEMFELEDTDSELIVSSSADEVSMESEVEEIEEVEEVEEVEEIEEIIEEVEEIVEVEEVEEVEEVVEEVIEVEEVDDEEAEVEYEEVEVEVEEEEESNSPK